MTLIIIIVIVLIIAIYAISTYNKFISLAERVTNGKAQIAAQIESRWDAVSNLIDATKKYATYETDTLNRIIAQRTSISENSSLDEIEQDDTSLNHVVGRLLAISENYPELKASEVYKTTMESVNKYENNVRHSRMIYNDVVTRFNRLVKMFPSNIIAKVFHFTTKQYFEATKSKAEMPRWE